MKKLLMLSGCAQMCEIVERAKEKGIYTIVTDYLTDSPAKKIADDSLMYSIDDVDGIVEYCKKNNVDGVMNYCIDPGQKPYQQICERLGLPCVGTAEQFNIMTNKDVFKDTCVKYGIGVPKSYTLTDPNNEDEVDKIEFPVIVKPVDSRASKGITLCKSKEDLPHAVQEAFKYSKQKKLIVEQYMQVPEICAKYVICDGEPYLTSVADVYTAYFGPGDRIYIWTQTYPSKHYKLFIKETDGKIRNMLNGIGIKNGVVSFTGFIDGEAFRFFDPSFRMGGAQDWRIVDAIAGIDVSDLLTNFAITGEMGKQSEIATIDKQFVKKSSAILYFLVNLGTIGHISGIEEALKFDGVIGYHAPHKDGDVVSKRGTVDHVVLRFLLVCDNNEMLKDTIKKIQSIIKIVDENGNDMLLPNFDANLI
jgi:biotin carboxylase